ncbi:MAG: UDP-N-acetylglucosamine--N-acetylmuramyl-(pentapeptide) pyrophosphoryl-undecaprenol N-acetylglucosamine transferase [bacterium]|nr:UDP-N-acetylglucosamine--N-acetylmuramyl-(pentapeptide) pyrophosphoryl-undecaprenol N-acetylglucosamine transferase [bacterium]
MANYRILLTGGGTGGHIYPLVAVAQKLPLGSDLRYFGDPEEFREYLQQSGIKIYKIASSKWRRYFSIQNFIDIFKFLWSLTQGLWKIFWFMPDVAFSKGGPGALAISLVCRFYRIPLVIHESDTTPGLTNKLSAGGARKIDLAFAEAHKHFANFKKAEINIVGQPIRAELLSEESGSEAKKSFGFEPSTSLVLVMGGSQGAETINDFILNNLANLLNKFQILHIVGPKNHPEYKREFDFVSQKMDKSLLKRYRYEVYLTDNLRSAYDASDIIISRAGSGSIFEIAAKGKPSVIIPLPTSANNHQEKNAYAYVESGAAIMIEEENLLENLFINEVSKILSDNNTYSKMSAAANSFYKTDAAEKIASDIMELASK